MAESKRPLRHRNRQRHRPVFAVFHNDTSTLASDPTRVDTSVEDVVSISTEEDDDACIEDVCIEDESDEDEIDDVSPAYSTDHIFEVQDPIAADAHGPQLDTDWFPVDPTEDPASDTISQVPDAQNLPCDTCKSDQAEAAPGITLEVDGPAEDVPDWEADLEAPSPSSLPCWTPSGSWASMSCHWNERHKKNLFTIISWEARLLPAAAVIPA